MEVSYWNGNYDLLDLYHNIVEIYDLYEELMAWENSEDLHFSKGNGIERRINTWYKRHKCNKKEQAYFRDRLYVKKLFPLQVLREIYESKRNQVSR